MKILKTARLNIRPYTLEDAAFTVELLNSPSWLKYIGDRKIYTITEAESYIRDRITRSYKEDGFGMYIVELNSNPVPIGACGLVNREGMSVVDLGFAFLPDYEGKGYGFESASAVLSHAFNDLGLDRLAAYTVEYNKPSIRLLEKLGFVLEGTTRLPGDDEELLLYSLSYSKSIQT